MAGPDDPDDQDDPGRPADPRPSQRIRIVGAEPAGAEGEGDPDEADEPYEPPAPPEADEVETVEVEPPLPTAGDVPQAPEGDDPNAFGAIPIISADDPPPGPPGDDAPAAEPRPPPPPPPPPPPVDVTPPPDEPAPTEAVPTPSTEPPADPGVPAEPTAAAAPGPFDDLADGGDDADLPHWTDPPSGQVPAVGDEASGAWAGLSTGPRWRGEGDTDDPVDFSDLRDEGTTFEASEGTMPPEDEDQPVVTFDDLQGAATTPVPAGGPPQRPDAGDAGDAGDPYPPQMPQGPEGGGGERDIQTAVMVGVGLAAAAIVSFLIGPAATAVLATVIIGLASAELFTALRKAGYHPVPLIGLAGTVGMMGAAYWRGEPAVPLVLFLVVMTTMLWWLLELSPDRAAPNMALTVFGVVYVGVLGSFAAMLLRLPNGIGLLLGAIIVTVAYDVGGLFVGQRWGSNPLSAASPNKTTEGLIGGGVAAVVASTVILGIIGVHPWETADAFALGIAGAIAAAIGDLCESRLKRDLGIKDMGDILPGHGGVLDRFDAMLFVLPTTFYVVRALEVFANTP